MWGDVTLSECNSEGPASYLTILWYLLPYLHIVKYIVREVRFRAFVTILCICDNSMQYGRFTRIIVILCHSDTSLQAFEYRYVENIKVSTSSNVCRS